MIPPDCETAGLYKPTALYETYKPIGLYNRAMQFTQVAARCVHRRNSDIGKNQGACGGDCGKRSRLRTADRCAPEAVLAHRHRGPGGDSGGVDWIVRFKGLYQAKTSM